MTRKMFSRNSRVLCKFNVTEDEYNKTKEHDTRYIAVAEAGDEVFYMNYYDPASYRLPADK